MSFQREEIQEVYEGDLQRGSTMCSSRPQPPNLEQVERRQYDMELAVNPGLRNPARSGPRKTRRR